MQDPEGERKDRSSATSEVILDRCLVEGDPAATSLARRARRKAFGASLTIEISLLTLLIAVPILTGVAAPPLHQILPPQLTFVRAWHKHSPAQQAASQATAHSGAVPNPFAVHPIIGVRARPIDNGELENSAGPDIPGLDIPGEMQVTDVGRTLLPVASPHISQPPPQEKRPVKLSEGVVAAQLISRIEPRYPPLAVQIHLQGVVQLHAMISREGRIASLEVVSGHPLLVQAALEAVQQWRYRPTLLDGEPVEVETTITVEFRLHN